MLTQPGPIFSDLNLKLTLPPTLLHSFNGKIQERGDMSPDYYNCKRRLNITLQIEVV